MRGTVGVCQKGGWPGQGLVTNLEGWVARLEGFWLSLDGWVDKLEGLVYKREGWVAGCE